MLFGDGEFFFDFIKKRLPDCVNRFLHSALTTPVRLEVTEGFHTTEYAGDGLTSSDIVGDGVKIPHQIGAAADAHQLRSKLLKLHTSFVRCQERRIATGVNLYDVALDIQHVQPVVHPP